MKFRAITPAAVLDHADSSDDTHVSDGKFNRIVTLYFAHDISHDRTGEHGRLDDVTIIGVTIYGAYGTVEVLDRDQAVTRFGLDTVQNIEASHLEKNK